LTFSQNLKPCYCCLLVIGFLNLPHKFAVVLQTLQLGTEAAEGLVPAPPFAAAPHAQQQQQLHFSHLFQLRAHTHTHQSHHITNTNIQELSFILWILRRCTGMHHSYSGWHNRMWWHYSYSGWPSFMSLLL
jgi:hypothetical protein